MSIFDPNNLYNNSKSFTRKGQVIRPSPLKQIALPQVANYAGALENIARSLGYKLESELQPAKMSEEQFPWLCGRAGFSFVNPLVYDSAYYSDVWSHEFTTDEIIPVSGPNCNCPFDLKAFLDQNASISDHVALTMNVSVIAFSFYISGQYTRPNPYNEKRVEINLQNYTQDPGYNLLLDVQDDPQAEILEQQPNVSATLMNWHSGGLEHPNTLVYHMSYGPTFPGPQFQNPVIASLTLYDSSVYSFLQGDLSEPFLEVFLASSLHSDEHSAKFSIYVDYNLQVIKQFPPIYS